MLASFMSLQAESFVQHQNVIFLKIPPLPPKKKTYLKQHMLTKIAHTYNNTCLQKQQVVRGELKFSKKLETIFTITQENKRQVVINLCTAHIQCKNRTQAFW